MRVILSRASHDHERVTALASVLRERGIVVGLYRWELLFGDDFAMRISRALEDSDAGLIVFSAAAVR